MATYSDAELEPLMADLESDSVERKESAADGRRIRRNVCAFANDLPGNGRPGVVLVGVRDDGTCASLPIDDDLLVRLSNIHGEGDILPLPSMTVQKRRLNGCDVAVVTVEPPAGPAGALSRPCLGPRRSPPFVKGPWRTSGCSANGAALPTCRSIQDPRMASSLKISIWTSCGDHYLPAAVAAEVLDRNRRTIEQQLRSLRLVQADRPTWGALLAFGRDPQGRLPGAYVQFPSNRRHRNHRPHQEPEAAHRAARRRRPSAR